MQLFCSLPFSLSCLLGCSPIAIYFFFLPSVLLYLLFFSSLSQLFNPFFLLILLFFSLSGLLFHYIYFLPLFLSSILISYYYFPLFYSYTITSLIFFSLSHNLSIPLLPFHFIFSISLLPKSSLFSSFLPL